MSKLIYTESLLRVLESSKTYTKSDIEHIMDEMETDYDKDRATTRILHFRGLVPQRTLLDIVDNISDTSKPSLFD